MASVESPQGLIANVAQAASDVVFNLQPSLAVGTAFSKHLDTESPNVRTLRYGNDPFGSIVEYFEENSSATASVTTNLLTLFQALPHLSRLSNQKLVIHVDTTAKPAGDYHLIASLRHAGFVFLQSFDLADAQSTAVAAYLIAAKLNKPVVQFFAGDAEYASGIKPIGTSEVASLVQEFTPAPQPEEEGEEEPTEKKKVSDAEVVAEALAKVSLQPFEYRGPKNAENAVVLFTSSVDAIAEAIAQSSSSDAYAKLGLVLIRVYRPWSTANLLEVLPKSVKRLALAEQIFRQTTSWSPLVQDIVINAAGAQLPQLVSYRLGEITYSTVRAALKALAVNLASESPVQKLFIGSEPEHEPNAELDAAVESAKKLEDAYVRILAQLFGSKLDIINATEKKDTGFENTPEYGFGAYLARQEKIKALQSKIQNALKANDFDVNVRDTLQDYLSQWALGTKDQSSVKDETVFANTTREAIALLEQTAAKSVTAQELLKYRDVFTPKSSWLIGSDAWAYDLGNSGVHHVISSGRNVNMLVIDSQPHSQALSSKSRKKDIGLYAMNFGNVYVASVAVYSSYTQLLQALGEAEKFDGPSVVVAYLPYFTESDDALTVLQETKKAVDTGYWPLYRYNPLLEEDAFKLDSFSIQKNLKEFLDRENKLTMLSKRSPALSRYLTSSYGSDVKAQQKSKVKEAYSKLLEGLSGPPLTILFASDGGTAESVAKRLERRAKGRGLKAVALAFDDLPAEELPTESNVVFITSTAGQGELPQNGRVLWDAIKNSTDLDLANIKFSVFGLGDSLYWPRKEDKIYYNKPAKDIYARVKLLGATELVPLGLGDEQDADGYSTAYNEWEPLLWTALGVDGVAGVEEPPPITNEDIKINSDFLRGTIAEGLRDASTGAISASDQQLTKFHGIYMQDDRDIRDERKAAGLEPAYSFMVRVRLPGCIATPDQWLRIDELSDKRGNGTFKITTRGTFQLHGVIKENLKPAIRGMNAALIDTVAACGDVDRNVVSAALPGNKKIHDEVAAVANDISEHLLPSTTAYHEIWLEGEDEGDGEGYTEAFANRTAGPKKKKTMVSGSTLVDHEPLYGPTYLPRKFKINIAVPPYNDVDVYGHDIGLIAIVEDNELLGFNVLAGGGMGTTHNNRKTYPRTGSLLGFVPKDKIVDACEKIMLVQRDNGDRKNRKHARLKYTIDDMTVDKFREETEARLGYKFESGRPYHFDSNIDTYGWVTDETGLHHFTTFVENGRVEDTPELQFRTGLREVAHVLNKYDGQFRLTGNQHILVSNVTDEALPEVKALLAKYKLDNLAFSGLRLSSAACVAFPTCGLAMAESERYLPVLITKLEEALEEYGLRHDSIVMRMTGCPNGCARPWLAEVALVGKALGAYNLMLGGGYHGQRLNKLYKSSLKEDEILAELKPLFKRWALERNEGEHFGDFLIRAGVIAETTEGKNFWDNVAEDA
ncbi:sulfite reductase [NADPH] subunit beta [Trichomonascus vanleenenianus]|uniref:sulfite reductase (NADPH) subunit beta n=1 Tax=Trichomonascus vanleenenianus TaxID=2268995 RepID=UPI003EC9ADE3